MSTKGVAQRIARDHGWPVPNDKRADMFHGICPECGRDLELYIDASSGPPDEVSTECDCGATPAWRVFWEYSIWIEGLVVEELS